MGGVLTCCTDRKPFWGAPVYESHHFASKKWEVVKPRDSDIVIVTAYKSGTTWMQQIVSEIIFQGQAKPATVGDLSPWVDLRVPPPEVIGPVIEGQTHRRFLKTHLPADAFEPYFNPKAKYIYVGRDGRDAFMSLMNHYEKGNEMWYGALNGPGLVGPPLPTWSEVAPAEKLFDKWLSTGWDTLPEEDGWPFWSFFKNVDTWWRKGQNNKNILFVHFNCLKADLKKEMTRIAEFLEVPVDAKLLPTMVQACTFEAMNKDADKVAPLNGALWNGGGKSFIFKGTNNRWKGVLSEEQVKAFEAKQAKTFTPECQKWITTGELP